MSTRHRYLNRDLNEKIDNFVTKFFFHFQQWRLLPYLAATYTLTHFSHRLFEEFVMFMAGAALGEEASRQVSVVRKEGKDVDTYYTSRKV